MIRKILANLWFWVVSSFLLIIIAWVLTIKAASKVKDQSIEEGEVIERQLPLPQK